MLVYFIEAMNPSGFIFIVEFNYSSKKLPYLESIALDLFSFSSTIFCLYSLSYSLPPLSQAV